MSLIKHLKHHVDQFGLDSKKKEAFSSFIKNGFPTTDNEEWKYTSLKKVINEDYVLSRAEKNTKDIATLEP